MKFTSAATILAAMTALAPSSTASPVESRREDLPDRISRLRRMKAETSGVGTVDSDASASSMSLPSIMKPKSMPYSIMSIDAVGYGSSKASKMTSKSGKANFCPASTTLTRTIRAPSVTPGTTVGGPAVPGGVTCGTYPNVSVQWYRVVGTGNTLTASTCNDGNPATGSAAYDSMISVFCDCVDLPCVGGNDDACSGLSSSFSWPSTPGQEYLVMIHGYRGAEGEFELAILDDGVQAIVDADQCTGDLVSVLPYEYEEGKKSGAVGTNGGL